MRKRVPRWVRRLISEPEIAETIVTLALALFILYLSIARALGRLG